MEMQFSYWKELLRNTVFSLILFLVVLCGATWLERLFDMVGTILKWDESSFIMSIPASICGVAYILTVRNPNNYLGFFMGMAMAILLAGQFYLLGNYDLVVLYIAVFVPIYIVSYRRWKRESGYGKDSEIMPTFLTFRQNTVTILLMLGLLIINYILTTCLIFHDGILDNPIVKFLSSTMIVTSIGANYWMIYKKVDTWIYWVLYSVAGLALNIIQANVFSLVLFLLFLIINSGVLIVWIRLVNKSGGRN